MSAMKVTDQSVAEAELRTVSATIVGINRYLDELRVRRIELIYELTDMGMSSDEVGRIAGISQPRIVQLNARRRVSA